MGRTRIKFCGMTSAADVEMAVEAGADAIGAILAPSPRRVTMPQVEEIARATPPFVSRVAVVTDRTAALAPTLRGMGFTIQFSEGGAVLCEALGGGHYLKVFHLDPADTEPIDTDLPHRVAYRHALWMFDSRGDERLGGSGVPLQWERLAAVARVRPIVVAGGLTPENVGDCVRAVRPYAVDVRSGVERDGRKDRERMRAFVRAVREADAET